MHVGLTITHCNEDGRELKSKEQKGIVLIVCLYK